MQTIRLVDSGWARELKDARKTDSTELLIVSPFIKVGALDRLLCVNGGMIKVITRFNLDDFAEGVSDIAALERLLRSGAQVRGIKHLHAKLYLFGASSAIVTSANLTGAALNKNHEFGLVARDRVVVAACRAYFETLWKAAGPNITEQQLTTWDATVTNRRIFCGKPNKSGALGDYGADAGLQPPPLFQLPTYVADAPQYFVKFLGEGKNRVPVEATTISELGRSDCHWGLTYPAAKRPTGVRDGAVMFISRLTKDPNDILIFGRAIAEHHVPGRDDATAEEIAAKPWKATWPRYVRVHAPRFVAGAMSNGVSLNELMKELGPHSFASTQRNAAKGSGNLNPHKAYSQQPAVEPSQVGFNWLCDRFEKALATHGEIPADELAKLTWPNGPQQPSTVGAPSDASIVTGITPSDRSNAKEQTAMAAIHGYLASHPSAKIEELKANADIPQGTKQDTIDTYWNDYHMTLEAMGPGYYTPGEKITLTIRRVACRIWEKLPTDAKGRLAEAKPTRKANKDFIRMVTTELERQNHKRKTKTIDQVSRNVLSILRAFAAIGRPTAHDF